MVLFSQLLWKSELFWNKKLKISLGDFWSGQDGITGPDLPPFQKQQQQQQKLKKKTSKRKVKNTWNNGFQDMDIRQWRTGRMWEANEVRPTIVPAHCLEGVSRLQHRKGNPSGARQTLWVEETETKVTRVCRTEYWRGESCNRENSGDLQRVLLKNSAEQWSAYACEENTWENYK